MTFQTLPSPGKKIKVLYILGAPRSGSTLLDRLLGQVNGFFSMGELKFIWRPVFEEDMLCGCGVPFRSCPFWTTVLHRALGVNFAGPNDQWSAPMLRLRSLLHARDSTETETRKGSELNASILRLRSLPLLLYPSISRKYREDLEFYSSIVSALCRAAHEVSGCRVLIDSSKANRDCIVLNRIQDFDLRVVHLVRDSRAVAYSWLRKQQRPEFHLRMQFGHRLRIRVSAREWAFTNAMSEALGLCLKHYVRINYEDLVADPRGTLEHICAAIGEPNPALDFIQGQTAFLGKAHTVAGNPMRFKEGPVTIQPDMEWAERLSKGQKALVLAYTWPLMLYYGYFKRSQTPRRGCRTPSDMVLS